MIIRKCVNGEMSRIIKVANAAFKPDRPKGYSFRYSVPHIYNNKKTDYSNIHFVAENDKKEFVSIGGNLIQNIQLKNEEYKFSFIGTIGTIPQYRHQGLMSQIVQEINNENIDNSVVFSILSGKRNRYQNFGYEHAGFQCLYTLDKQQENYLSKNKDISVKKFKNKDLDTLYQIYTDNQKFTLRNKDNFVIYLNNHNNKLYTIFDKSTIIGYLAIKGTTITEINLINNNYLENILAYILTKNLVKYETNDHNDKYILASVNRLNNSLIQAFDKLADSKQLIEKYSFKVYDLIRFIKMLFAVNSNTPNNIEEIYKVADKTYKFEKNNKRLSIKETTDKPQLKFENQADFIRFVMGNTDINNSSSIFPLFFDINICDNF